mmetsp:Transcript_114979/g.199357  ORF Transcript_114979/g.199357 Transcript_114979/m.199357 type:complete len:258 (-) Transcript_114979:114-887(-)
MIQNLRLVVTRLLDSIFSCLGFGAHHNPARMQLLICLLNIIFSIVPIIMYIWVSVNIHVIFWLGMAPQYANICVPIALSFLNMGTIAIKYLQPKAEASRISCFLIFLTLGSVMLGVGLYVQILAYNVAEDLIHRCGASTLSAQLESEWQRLNAFYQQCYVMQGKLELIEQCPGFAEAFPNRVFANYIEDIEYDYNCVGFCQFWAQPLFNMDADRNRRCATEIGEEMEWIGNTVGMPTMLVGLMVVLVGACLALYDHL